MRYWRVEGVNGLKKACIVLLVMAWRGVNQPHTCLDLFHSKSPNLIERMAGKEWDRVGMGQNGATRL